MDNRFRIKSKKGACRNNHYGEVTVIQYSKKFYVCDLYSCYNNASIVIIKINESLLQNST